MAGMAPVLPTSLPWTEKAKPEKTQMALEWLVVQKQLLAYRDGMGQGPNAVTFHVGTQVEEPR